MTLALSPLTLREADVFERLQERLHREVAG